MRDYIWIKRADDQLSGRMHALGREDVLRQMTVSLMHETFWQRAVVLFGSVQESAPTERRSQPELGECTPSSS